MGQNAEAKKRLEEQAVIESRIAYQTKFLKIRHDIVKEPGAEPHVWDIVIHPGAVAVIAIDEDDKLVLVEQWRRAIGRITLELPAGLIDEGESLEECAQRELQEESGLRAQRLTYLGGYFSSPGIFTEHVHLFIAKDLVPSRLHADDTDGIDVKRITKEEALKRIEDGSICDAKTALGILRALYV